MGIPIIPILWHWQWMSLSIIYIFTILMILTHTPEYIRSSSPAVLILFSPTTSCTKYLVILIWGNTNTLSADLLTNIRGRQYQHTSNTKIRNCTPYWSTYYMCSIFHGFLVVSLMLIIKKLVSKVDICMRWEYPTRTRGTDFRRMLSATKDVLEFFLE